MVTLDDLAAPDPSEPLRILRAVFSEPEALRPTFDRAELTDALGAIAILALVCTAIAFLLFAALIDEIGPVRATVITYVNPAVAAALGVAVQRDPFTAAMGLGFLLVILGSAFAARSPTMSTADGRVDVGDDRPPAAGVDEVVA